MKDGCSHSVAGKLVTCDHFKRTHLLCLIPKFCKIKMMLCYCSNGEQVQGGGVFILATCVCVTLLSGLFLLFSLCECIHVIVY